MLHNQCFFILVLFNEYLWIMSVYWLLPRFLTAWQQLLTNCCTTGRHVIFQTSVGSQLNKYHVGKFMIESENAEHNSISEFGVCSQSSETSLLYILALNSITTDCVPFCFSYIFMCWYCTPSGSGVLFFLVSFQQRVANNDMCCTITIGSIE